MTSTLQDLTASAWRQLIVDQLTEERHRPVPPVQTCACGLATAPHSCRCHQCQTDAVYAAARWTHDHAQHESERAMNEIRHHNRSNIIRRGLAWPL